VRALLVKAMRVVRVMALPVQQMALAGVAAAQEVSAGTHQQRRLIPEVMVVMVYLLQLLAL